ncbi:MAG: hypothetical protein ACRD2O_05635 [Terriglobia bacterium]
MRTTFYVFDHELRASERLGTVIPARAQRLGTVIPAQAGIHDKRSPASHPYCVTSPRENASGVSTPG